MPRIFTKTISVFVFSAIAASSSVAFAQTATKAEPFVIEQQGSFAVGGTVSSKPGTYNNNAPTAEGQTLHGDHAYVFHQVPQNPKPLPIVMLHGAFQSARSWETTPDGREGFQNIFLRRAIEPLRSAHAALRIHTHVQRTIVTETEAALRHV